MIIIIIQPNEYYFIKEICQLKKKYLSPKTERQQFSKQ